MRAVSRLATDLDPALGLEDLAGDNGFLFVRDGVGVAGRGVAARAPVDEVPALLAAIERSGDGPGPIALGGLPFRPGQPGQMVIPSVAVRRTATGEAWVTTIDGASAELAPANGPLPSASAYAIDPVNPVATYLRAVDLARQAVRDGRLTKAVIAREIIVTADRPIDRHGVLRRLRATFGSSYRFAIDGFIGASPELLVEVEGRAVRSHPLAGTAPRTGDVDLDAQIAEDLVASTKNQVEHRVVIDVVHDTLLPWCSFLDWEPDPSIVTVANVQHLGTRVEGRLSTPTPNVIELVRALSPTPALGGHPRDAALELIDEIEGVDRGRYGGAVGWVDASGDGTWAVAIRCAELSDDRCRARLHAGGGIVADSDPLAELAETQAKFQAMLSALIRP
ncbi:MAG: isochorismate synthase [Ilumatobacteraceae bacterium]